MTKLIRLTAFLALSILVLLTSACSSSSTSETTSIPETTSSEDSINNESSLVGAQAAKSDTDLTLEEMLKPIFDEYNVVIPSDNAKNHLIIPTSIEESLKTGVQAEIDNIAMYELFLTKQLPEDVKSVFTELMVASESHLDAFQNNLNK